MSAQNGAQPTSFFARVKAELSRLFVHVPGWEASAAATLTYIAPMVESIVALAEPSAAPLIDALIQKIQSAMAAAAVVVKDAGPKPTLATYLNAISADLSQIAAFGQSKDSESMTKITALIQAITGEVTAILQEISPAKT